MKGFFHPIGIFYWFFASSAKFEEKNDFDMGKQ
jgi:hypothetical protein